MIIDGHAHAAGRYSTVESILDTTKKFQIGKVLLCTSPKNNLGLKEPPNLPFMKSPRSIYLLNRMLRMGYRSMKMQGDGNEYVRKLSQSLPDLVVPFLWVNPIDPSHLDHLEKNIQSCQPAGIKLHQAWDAFKIDGPEFARLVEVTGAHKLPIFIHLYSRRETYKLLRFTECHRDAIFIIAHMLGLDIFQEKRTDLPNLFFDTSCSERVRGQDIMTALNLFGREHVIFGTDTPYARIEDQLAKIEQLNLSGETKEHILGTNIQNLLHLQ